MTTSSRHSTFYALLVLTLGACSVVPTIEVDDTSYVDTSDSSVDAYDAFVDASTPHTDAHIAFADAAVAPVVDASQDANEDANVDASTRPPAELVFANGRGMGVRLSVAPCEGDSSYVLRGEASRPLAEVVSYFGDESVGDARIVSSRVFEITLNELARSYVTGGSYLRVGIVPADASPPYTLAVTFSNDAARITDASLMRFAPDVARAFARELRSHLADLYEHDSAVIEASGGADYWTARGNVSMELVHEIVDDPRDLRTFEGTGFRVLVHPDVVWPGSSHKWVGIYDENEAALVSLERR